MRRDDFYAPFPRNTPRAGRKIRDPYLYVLVCQTVLCLLLVLCGLALREAKPALWPSLKTGYEQLILSPESVDDFIQHFSRQARDTLTQMIEGQTVFPSSTADMVAAAPDEPDADEEDSSSHLAPSAATVGTLQPVSIALSGMGGSGTPENCSLAPVLLTAALEPPVSGRVTSPYGWRAHPITENDDFHRGIDIAAARDSAVHAVLPGIVAETGESPIYGNFVRLDHGHGLQTAYSHCETIAVRTGENLRKGEVLATVGSTGISTGPHIHFELLVKGVYYDPAWVMNGLTKYGD